MSFFLGMGAYRRNPWTPEEDERLIQAVQSHGTDGGWTKIGGLGLRQLAAAHH